jgi:hypothetical protein
MMRSFVLGCGALLTAGAFLAGAGPAYADDPEPIPGPPVTTVVPTPVAAAAPAAPVDPGTDCPRNGPWSVNCSLNIGTVTGTPGLFGQPSIADSFDPPEMPIVP